MPDKEQPLVSVLVPLYNHEAYIGCCLDSILADTYSNKEIIVIDDGSRDNSAHVVRQWQKSHAHQLGGEFTFVSRENQGISRTLNELITRSRGSYITFVSSDDFLLADSIRVRMDYLLANPAKGLVLCDYSVVDRDGAILYPSGIEGFYRGNKRCLTHDDLIAYELIYRWSIAGPVYLYRKNVFREIGGYDEQLIVEDWDMCLKMAARDLVGFVNFPGAAYRLHGANVVSQPGMASKMLENQIATALRYEGSFTGLKLQLLHAYVHQARFELQRAQGGGSSPFYPLVRIYYKLIRWLYRRKVAITLAGV